MAFYGNVKEGEVINNVREDFFSDFDCKKLLGNIDFCVAEKNVDIDDFDVISLMWAESKKGGNKDIYESFVQLILTIGKERTYERYIPPMFLGAYDADKIAFIEYHKINDIFFINDFNWNVTPSDHTTPEFILLLDKVKDILEREMLIFSFNENGGKELRRFIKKNFVRGKRKLDKLKITKNNFTFVYHKWTQYVKPTIGIDWNLAKQKGILDADFFYADLFLEDGEALKDALYVILKDDRYIFDRNLDASGFNNYSDAQFTDSQRAYNQFWNHYERPPKEKFWDFIIEHRPLLVPQDVRERKGSYFTPRKWVEKSQEYLAETFGEEWQSEYYIWDCCAGTGNLLYGLLEKERIWASTLDKQDVDIMKDRIKNGFNMLDKHVFKFDFLNDDFNTLPSSLKNVVNDPEKRKKLIVYINPPYAEAGNRKSIKGGKPKEKVAVTTKIYQECKDVIGIAGRELSAQFFYRIYNELPDCILATFATPKALNGANFLKFRNFFQAELKRSYIVPGNTFDNVKGKFPIGFYIWDTSKHVKFEHTSSDVYEANGEEITGYKNFFSYDGVKSINDWLIETRNRENERKIGYLSCRSHDVSHVNDIYFKNTKADIKSARGTWITDKNLLECCIYVAVSHSLNVKWVHDRDQFLYPNDGWKTNIEFQNDCIAYTLFSDRNIIKSSAGTNHWIPFTVDEVAAKDSFESNLMSKYINGTLAKKATAGLFDEQQIITEKYLPASKLIFSSEAQAVIDAGREVWKYYHQQPNINPNASLYEIKEFFCGKSIKGEKNPKETLNQRSKDEHFNELMDVLKQAHKRLSRKIEPKVYEYGFMIR